MFALRAIYTLLFTLAAPGILLRWCVKSIKEPLYRKRMAERFGFYEAKPQVADTWFHAVSFGEVEVVKPYVLDALSRGEKVLVTTTTASGSKRVQEVFADKVQHVYLPLELPNAIKRFLNAFSPKKCIIMETEIWPNLYHYVSQKKIPIIIANARLSEKSLSGYLKIKAIIASSLKKVSMLLAQTEEDKERFVTLGLDPALTRVCGNIKFDIKPSNKFDELRDQYRAALAQREVVLAASTHPGEEGIVCDAYLKLKKERPQAFMLLAPRHPNRREEVIAILKEKGLSFASRSETKELPKDKDVYLIDTLGELALFFGVANVSFIGGSLIPHGGHNVLEPIAQHVPVTTGPHVFNFQSICDMLTEAQGISTIEDAEGLASELKRLLEDEIYRVRLNANARKVYQQNQGALKRQLEAITSV